jgi:hypothetical protein
MKTKIAILILSVVTLVSFTALTTIKKNKAEAKAYQSGGGHEMTDKGQFN